MSQLHIAPLFIFCLVLNDYHNALSVFGLIICYCFILRFYCVVFLCFCGAFIYLSAMPLEAYKRKEHEVYPQLLCFLVQKRGTKLRHIRPHNGLQGFTCFEVVGRVSAEMAR